MQMSCLKREGGGVPGRRDPKGKSLAGVRDSEKARETGCGGEKKRGPGWLRSRQASNHPRVESL